MVDGETVVGFPTPSRKHEFFSKTMVDWKWPEYAIPVYIKAIFTEDNMDRSKGDFPSGPDLQITYFNSLSICECKMVNEIANRNPVWMHPADAENLGVETDDLIRVNTDIGYFVDKVWVTEGMKPGVVACSHHLGRWRRPQDVPGNRWGIKYR